MLSSRLSASTPDTEDALVFSGVLRADGLRLGTLLARDLVTADRTPGLSRLSLFVRMSDSCRWGDVVILVRAYFCKYNHFLGFKMSNH